MEEHSRVKKYENLRKNINEESNNENLEMSAILDELNRTVKQEEAGKTHYVPTHKQNHLDKHLVEATGEFKNEYLDSFIQEVRDYNIRKGVRDNEDTRLDILQQLSSKQRKKRADYIEDVNQNTTPDITLNVEDVELDTLYDESENIIQHSEDRIASTQEIARQVQELLNSEENEIQEDTAIEEEPMVEELNLDEAIGYSDEVEVSTQTSPFSRDQLLEETLKLKVQLDEYEEELNSLNDGVSKNNKLLNVVIGVLVFLLLSIIGLVVYWLSSGGYF